MRKNTPSQLQPKYFQDNHLTESGSLKKILTGSKSSMRFAEKPATGDSFSRKINFIDGFTIIKVHLNRLTLNETKSFKEYILDDCNMGTKNLVLDLHNCAFMDSTFCGALIQIAKRQKRIGGSLHLVVKSDDLNILFVFGELKRILNVHSDIESAVQSFKPNQEIIDF